jgi:hypothetical protein
MNIDYLPDEMNAYAKGMKLPEISEFYRGWRAACEAMHKKAQAKAEPVFWAYADNGEYCKRIGGVWRGVHIDDDGYEHDDLFEDDEIPHLEAMSHGYGWVWCDSEAEARRVAGFADAEANP